MMKRILFLLIVTVVNMNCGPAVLAGSGATAGFKKLQSLVGEWRGKDEEGKSVTTKFRLIASSTAVMETLAASGMDEMVTLYSVDGDAILLLHYCPTNNQPRMRALPQGDNVKELVFSFEGAANLMSPSAGHEHKLVMQFQDKDHITERWTWRQNGKDSEMVYHFARKSGS